MRSTAKTTRRRKRGRRLPSPLSPSATPLVPATSSLEPPAPVPLYYSEDEGLTEEEKRLRQIERNQPAIALLRSWRECSDEEAEEQRETWEYLKRALNEDRMSYRKRIP